jgi:hypothetical protein
MQVVRDYAPCSKRLGPAGPLGWEEEADDRPGLGLAWEAKTLGIKPPSAAPVSPQDEYEAVESNIL